MKWRTLHPDDKHNWLTNKNDGEFAALRPSWQQGLHGRSNLGLPTIFRSYSLGVSTNRDSVVYGFDAERLAKRVEQFVDDYNAELDRWRKESEAAGGSEGVGRSTLTISSVTSG